MAIFGNNGSVDAGTGDWSDTLSVQLATLPVDGFVTSISYNTANTGTSHALCYTKAIIFNQSAGTPTTRPTGALGDEQTHQDLASYAWTTSTFSSPIQLAAGDYYIGFHGSGTAVGLMWGRTTGTATSKWASDTYSDGTLTSWPGGSNMTYLFCVYGTYYTEADRSVLLKFGFGFA